MAKIKRINSMEELYNAFGHLFPDKLLDPAQDGLNSRERNFSGRVTFWGFAAQILSPGSSCREMVRRIDAWWEHREHRRKPMSGSTSAYCQARARLDPEALELIAGHLSRSLEANTTKEECWLGGRSVKIVDGTGLSMPDTPENQAVWPQSSEQKAGCGFPMMKLVGLFSLSSGAMLEGATGNRHVHESLRFRDLGPKLRKGDIVLGDRGFCSYAALASLGRKGVDRVMRLHAKRRADFRTGQRLGIKDRLVTWRKPTMRTGPWSKEEFDELPDELTLRMIEIQVEAEGFRTRKVVLVTTLLDPEAYPAGALRELYAERWKIELPFNQIKTLLEMDVLRCKSPEMIEREVLMHRVAYNLVRSLMQQARIFTTCRWNGLASRGRWTRSATGPR